MKLHDFSKLVALPHSVFALPFALSAFLLAARENVHSGETLSALNFFTTLLAIVIAVIAARTAAMAMNRVVDREFDAANPRTKSRELPRGAVSPSEAWSVVLGASGVFIATTWILGPHCLALSPIVLLVLFAYSFAKRFTRLSHFALGVALALAPGGAWWVLRPKLEAPPLLLMAAVLVWVAGFDILYACQDVEFDRRQGLYSIPAKHGTEVALRTAFALHLAAVALFLLLGVATALPRGYFGAITVLALPLLGQHILLKPWDLRRIDSAFFTANGIVSILFLIAISLSISYGGG